MRRRTTAIVLTLCFLFGGCALPFGWSVWGSTTPYEATDSGFRPDRDGFTFANYGVGSVTNLVAADVQRMFGDVVCATTQPSCTLTPTAQIWMDEMNRAMANGHCEGMAVLSQYFYYGVLQPTTFGAQNAAELSLTDNTDLQREIAYWWATQATYPTRAFRVVSDPRSIIATLQAGLTHDADVAQLYTIGLYAADFTGGHTVTPIALRTIDAQTVAIQLYDNNTPKQTPEIVVDMEANTWRYDGHAADGKPVSYQGDAASQTMDMTATAPRLEVQECPFCDQNPLVRSVSRLTTILFSATKTALRGNEDGYAAYFVDSQGRRVGVIRGVVYNEIPHAQVTFLRGADAQWSARGLPLIALPDDVEGTIKVTGAASVPVNITAFSAGRVLGIQEMRLDETVASDIRFDAKNGAVAVASAAPASPRVVVATTNDNQSIAHTVRNLQFAPGGKTAVSTGVDGSTVTVASDTVDVVEIRTEVDANDGQAPRERDETQTVTDPATVPELDDMAPAPVERNQAPPVVVPTETLPPTVTMRPSREPKPTRADRPEPTDTDGAPAATDERDEADGATATRRPQRTPTSDTGSADGNPTKKPTEVDDDESTGGTKQTLTPTPKGGGKDDDDEKPGREDPPPTPTPTWSRWRPTPSRERPEGTRESDRRDPTRVGEPTRRADETRGPPATERPEATRRAESTERPERTERPEATRQPTRTERPEPTDEPEPTERREPTRTNRPEPTKRPERTERPEPTERPERTQRPEPTERREPTRTRRR